MILIPATPLGRHLVAAARIRAILARDHSPARTSSIRDAAIARAESLDWIADRPETPEALRQVARNEVIRLVAAAREHRICRAITA